MKRPTLCLLFLFLVSPVWADDIATIRAFLDTPTDDVTVLHSVYIACLNLTRTGTADAVPVLKQLLADERFSTVARTALINIPGDAGVKALRESLQTLQGKNRIAVINTLGNVRDAESVEAINEVGLGLQGGFDWELIVASIRALGNIATEEVADDLNRLASNVLEGGMPFNRVILSEVLLNVADRLVQSANLEERDDLVEKVTFIYHHVMAMSEPGVRRDADAAVLGVFSLFGTMGEHGARLAELNFYKLFTHNAFKDILGGMPFNAIQRIILEAKFDNTGTIVLDNMGGLPVWQQAALVRNLGARKESAIVPRLIELMTQSDEQALRLAAVSTLGEIGDLRAVDAVLLAIGAEDAELSEAARESLKRFEGEDFDRKIIRLLNNSNKALRLAALDVVGTRQIAAASHYWHMEDALTHVDRDTRLAAYKAFANSAPPTRANISVLHGRLMRIYTTRSGPRLFTPAWEQREAEQQVIRDAILILCRRTGERDSVVNFFATLSLRLPEATFHLDCLFVLGGEKAAAALAEVAMLTALDEPPISVLTEEDNARRQANRLDALHNRATELLGQWTTPEVAPHLIYIAEHHPVERYRSRTFRGYLRVIRQMGLPVEQKVEMAEKAVAVADAVGLSDADKEQAAEILRHFRAMLTTAE